MGAGPVYSRDEEAEGRSCQSLQIFPRGVRGWSQILPSGAQRQDKELLPQIKTQKLQLNILGKVLSLEWNSSFSF